MGRVVAVCLGQSGHRLESEDLRGRTVMVPPFFLGLEGSQGDL